MADGFLTVKSVSLFPVFDERDGKRIFLISPKNTIIKIHFSN